MKRKIRYLIVCFYGKRKLVYRIRNKILYEKLIRYAEAKSKEHSHYIPPITFQELMNKAQLDLLNDWTKNNSK